MTRLEQIEQDVAGLSPDELARFRDWFEAYAAERFDAALAADAEAGRLDALADAALEDFRAGRSRRL
ncbi:hypothetical protein VSX64_09035 [Aurantimonas sp. C2-6-R+9]|uniref:hypothetical protein n=1 Tax=unclassified Aurantimonas TaxID=2638230 RepID=UPI002E172AAA|nr:MULTISPECIES: hypothetical protein [unclassified Aurantimonas]MEC5290845.1 hypothetical protein [Aurantimonas sp. C2-3-R2]MEC5381022.1 hypothetical protein [Aurantimonas sp. C2-6-R+9]MEC5411995.1 hypothetical protein [Aurantimonas sp. C2-4-R8]